MKMTWSEMWGLIGYWAATDNYYRNVGFRVYRDERGVVIIHPDSISYCDGI
jgi:hypothetical protein